MRKMMIVCYLILISEMGFSGAMAEPRENTQDRMPVIGYSGSPASIDYWQKLRQSVFSRAKELGVIVLDFTSNEFTLEAQQTGLLLAAELNVDGMIIGAVTDEISDSIEVFREKNIPVVAVGTAIFNDWVSTTVAINEQKAARLAGRYIQERLATANSGASRVVILCGEKVQQAARVRASVPHRMLTDAGYEVQDYYAKGWTAWQPLSDAIAEFSAHGDDIAAVFACYADASIAGVEAAESFGLRPLLLGFDMDRSMYRMIEDGRLDGTVVQDPARIGQVGIEAMISILKGNKPPSPFIGIPARLITRENLKTDL